MVVTGKDQVGEDYYMVILFVKMENMGHQKFLITLNICLVEFMKAEIQGN